MQKLITGVLLFLLLWLQYRFWLGPGSWQEQRLLRQQIHAQVDENTRLEARNSALQTEVTDLKQGLGAIEERARLELGMVKKGENFYQIVDDGNGKEKEPH